MTTEPLRVLLVEDNPGDAHLVERALARARPGRFDLAWVDRLARGLEELTDGRYTVVLLDLDLPDARGLETLERLRAACPRPVPVVILTGRADEGQAIAALGVGAQDYLVKGTYEGTALARSIAYAVERHRMQERLLQQALRDDLTDTYNRRGLTELGHHRIELAARRGEHVAALVIDVDGLKQVNDTLGHAQGSRLIRDVATILAATARASDLVARLGGDEFAVLLSGPPEAPAALVRRIRARVAAFDARRVRPYRVSISIGWASRDARRPIDLDELLEEADRAMYRDKAERRAQGLRSVAG